MKSFTEFNEDQDEQVIEPESNATKRHKVKEQLSQIGDDWQEYDDDFERFEKFKSRK